MWPRWQWKNIGDVTTSDPCNMVLFTDLPSIINPTEVLNLKLKLVPWSNPSKMCYGIFILGVLNPDSWVAIRKHGLPTKYQRLNVDLANVPMGEEWYTDGGLNLKTEDESKDWWRDHTKSPATPAVNVEMPIRQTSKRCGSEKHLNMIALILDLSTRGPRHINIDCRGSRGSPAAFLSCNSFRCLFWVTNNLFFKKITRQLEPIKMEYTINH